MSSLLSAELAATCNALGYFDQATNKYHADSNTLETIKDLIRYLRRDDENHDIRRFLGETQVLQTDLLPLLKCYWEESDLFDVLLRLLVNLTSPALMLWNEQVPTESTARNYFLQISDHLEKYKQAFADQAVWAVLSTKLSQILETDFVERGEENSLVIERVLILVRNVLYVQANPDVEKRPDNDASIHDQVLWALHQSGMLDILLFITSSANEQAYYMHALEILSFMLREQSASELAQAALQRTQTEKMRDEAELLSIRHREAIQKQQKIKMYTGTRHSRFGGTFVVKSMKSISDNELIYHKPLINVDALNFDADKKKLKTPKNRLPVKGTSLERLSAFSVRLFLKEFCIEFLNGAYNTLMYHVKDNLVRAKAQTHDESYYLWAMRFFMEFNRSYKFEVKLVSETMSIQTFYFVQKQMEDYFDCISMEKKNFTFWSRRLHLALLAYKELLLTICAMDKSSDKSVRDSANVIKSNIFYVLEYRELIVTLMVTFDEIKMSNLYLNDLIETQHIFIKMFQTYCEKVGDVVVQKKGQAKRKRKANAVEKASEINLEALWDEAAPQLSAVLEGEANIPTDVIPFDAASDVPIDEQKSEAMKNIQLLLRENDFENALGLLRAAREVWPENDCFGSSLMAPEDELLALRDIFFAELGEKDRQKQDVPIEENENDDDDIDEEEMEGFSSMSEATFKFTDFTKRLCNRKIIKACSLALRNFDKNPVQTNHCIVKLLHRIAFDSKMYTMLFQASIFRTFQRIYSLKDLPQFQELAKFATYIMRQFFKVAQSNSKVFMEALFWKSPSETFDIENGYGSHAERSQAESKAWTELQEDELRKLFVEHKEKQISEDVVDWIVNNLIDNTRTRRAVLKKLKEMCLLTEYKRPRKSGISGKIPKQWGEDEQEQLRELYEQFKDAMDPLSCIMDRLDVRRPKNRIVEKLLVMGLIQDKKEVRKKRAGKSLGSRAQESPVRHSDTSDNEDDDSDQDSRRKLAGQPARQQSKKSASTKKKVQKGKTIHTLTIAQITKAIVEVKDMTEALEWLKESISDVAEDLDANSNDDDEEGVPLVAITEAQLNAMEDYKFLQLLKAFGIQAPSNEQETYWRIPGHLTLNILQQYCQLINSALDGTLVLDTPINAVASENISSDDDDIFDQIRKLANHTESLNKDEDVLPKDIPDVFNIQDGRNNEEDELELPLEDNCGSESKPKRKRIAIESDDDVEINNKENVEENVFSSPVHTIRRITDSDSETDNKRQRSPNSGDSLSTKKKRSRIFISDNED